MNPWRRKREQERDVVVTAWEVETKRTSLRCAVFPEQRRSGLNGPWLLHLPGCRLIWLPLRMNQSPPVQPPLVESFRLIPVIEIFVNHHRTGSRNRQV